VPSVPETALAKAKISEQLQQAAGQCVFCGSSAWTNPFRAPTHSAGRAASVVAPLALEARGVYVYHLASVLRQPVQRLQQTAYDRLIQ
jgi:hypothetical protein